MKHPWQTWTLFLLCLAVVLPAMVWLTVKAVELDRTQAEAQREAVEARQKETEARRQAESARHQADIARRQAEQQELISNALWRMDSMLTPLVAQEAARPYYVYQPFYPAPSGKSAGGVKAESEEKTPSPLLVQPSEYVLLHFQLGPEGSWSSPQNPTGTMCPPALAYTTPENIRSVACSLDVLKGELSHRELLAVLPERSLPAIAPPDNQWVNYTLGYNSQPAGYGQASQDAADQPNAEGLQEETAAYGVYDSGTRRGAPQQQADAPAVNQQAARTAPGQQAPPDGDGYRRDQFMRGGYEWEQRNQIVQNFAQSQILQQRVNNDLDPAAMLPVREGVSTAVWLDSKLLLARRVFVQDQELIQGCWLDWPKIKEKLEAEVADLLPDAELVPVTPDEAERVPAGRMLATLPVQVVVPEPTMTVSVMDFDVVDSARPARSESLSAIQISLIVAWACLLLTAVAVGITLSGVMRLSERRGAFVSAVTHELRTPLTTFRMYAEMLAEGMVKDPAQQQHYANTLRSEADRLSHLVENVLCYARLERGRPGKRREVLPLGELLDRSASRLSGRAEEAGLELVVQADESVRKTSLATDPAAVEQILFNLVDNASKYAASAEDRRILLTAELRGRRILLAVRDYGPGISRREQRRLFRPFSKSVEQAAVSAPGVGLGLALCRRLACDLGGSLTLQSAAGEGAEFVLSLPA